MAKYIWSSQEWPKFRWDEEVVEAGCKLYSKQISDLDAVFESLTEDMQKQVIADAIAHDAVDSSALEGVAVSYQAVYTAAAKLLGFEDSKCYYADCISCSLAEILMDSSRCSVVDFSLNHMLKWHRKLFEGLSGYMRPALVGTFRTSPVYVVRCTGYMQSEILYEGVPFERLSEEVDAFMTFIKDVSIPNVVRSAVAAVWFALIHPFQDGNGRLSRILSDMVLYDGKSSRILSIASMVRKHKSVYYALLEKMDTLEELDITDWICWYIDIVIEAVKDADDNCRKKFELSAFMSKLSEGNYNKREIDMLYRLASGTFYGKLTAEKWSRLMKCSSSTASRDLKHLVEVGLLIREGDGGRGTYYRLNPDATNI